LLDRDPDGYVQEQLTRGKLARTLAARKARARAEYGEQVLEALSREIQPRVGRGYSARNLWYFRSFYLTYAERSPSIFDAASVFGTSLVPNLPGLSEQGAAQILHKPSAKSATSRVEAAASGFSSRPRALASLTAQGAAGSPASGSLPPAR